MTPTTQIISAERSTDVQVVTLVSLAHFVSHYHFYVLPPLFLMVKQDFDVSYTELGITLFAFHLISAVLQTPAGFFVDRFSAKWSLVAGLVIGGGAFVVAGLVSSFYVFVAMFGLAGLANTVYHPADYAILSKRVSQPRMSYAFSVHSFAGFIGTAVTPACQVMLASAFGWRYAFIVAGSLGLAGALLLTVFGESLSAPKDEAPKKMEPVPHTVRRDILLSPAILMNVVFFILISLCSGAIQSYGLVALQALWGFSLSGATVALSAYLVLASAGVIAGGFVAARTSRHDFIAMGGVTAAALAILPIGLFDLGTAIIIGLMAVAGFFAGLITASRDMLVKAVTPHGQFGSVFGYVSTGFSIGGIATPFIFGWLMDHDKPAGIFIGACIFGLLIVPILMLNSARTRAMR